MPIKTVPVLVTDALFEAFDARLKDTPTYRRRLRPTDPATCIGVSLSNFVHTPSSAQIGQREPAFGVYTFTVQNMVKHSDEEQGRMIYDVQCALVRAVLYRNTQLGVRLLGAEEVIEGSFERVKRFGIRRQDFLASKMQAFTYLCTTEVYVEVEITTA